MAALKATIIGSESKEFMYADKDGDFTSVPAKVKSVNGAVVVVEVSDPNGPASVDISMPLAQALKLFPESADPIGGTMDKGQWSGLTALMAGMPAGYSPATGGFQLRGVLLVMAALGTIKSSDVTSLATAGQDDFRLGVESAPTATDERPGGARAGASQC